ncbi:MAG: MarR family transcriptional regulator [Oscillospiraceae bacterium]|nr:MarR family transcriptional regulator [Oscillospiraceae bacterium]
MELTGVQIRYLLAIQELWEAHESLRSVELSRRLGVSKPSVHRVLAQLEGLGLLERAPYGAACLTQTGEETARSCAASYRHLATCLTERLALCPETARRAALALMVQLDREELEQVR